MSEKEMEELTALIALGVAINSSRQRRPEGGGRNDRRGSNDDDDESDGNDVKSDDNGSGDDDDPMIDGQSPEYYEQKLEKVQNKIKNMTEEELQAYLNKQKSKYVELPGDTPLEKAWLAMYKIIQSKILEVQRKNEEGIGSDNGERSNREDDDKGKEDNEYKFDENGNTVLGQREEVAVTRFVQQMKNEYSLGDEDTETLNYIVKLFLKDETLREEMLRVILSETAISTILEKKTTFVGRMIGWVTRSFRPSKQQAETKKENTKLKEKLKKCEEEKAELESKVNDGVVKNAQLVQQNSALVSDSEALRTEVQNKQKKLNQTSTFLSAKKEELLTLGDKYTKTRIQLGAVQKRVLQLESEKNTNAQRDGDLGAENESLTKAIAKLNNQVSELQATLKASGEARKEAKSKLQDASQRAAAAENAEKQVRRELDESKAQLQSELSKAEGAARGAQTELEALKVSNAGLRGDLTSARQAAEEARGQLQVIRESNFVLKNKVLAAEEEAGEAQREHQKAQASKSALEEKLEAATESLKEATAKQGRTNKLMTGLEKKLGEMNAENVKLQEKLETCQREKEDLERSNQELRQSLQEPDPSNLAKGPRAQNQNKRKNEPPSEMPSNIGALRPNSSEAYQNKRKNEPPSEMPSKSNSGALEPEPSGSSEDVLTKGEEDLKGELLGVFEDILAKGQRFPRNRDALKSVLIKNSDLSIKLLKTSFNKSSAKSIEGKLRELREELITKLGDSKINEVKATLEDLKTLRNEQTREKEKMLRQSEENKRVTRASTADSQSSNLMSLRF